jgi:hypothetical protein
MNQNAILACKWISELQRDRAKSNEEVKQGTGDWSSHHVAKWNLTGQKHRADQKKFQPA